MSETPEAMFSDGAAYERLMGRWSKLAGRQFLDWLALPSGLSWLDCGCGNGAFTEEIAKITAPDKVTGVDPSDAQIAFARSRGIGSNAAFEVGSAEALPLPNAAFDASVMSLAIAFVPDPAKAVAELARVTRSGGTVASYMWDLKAHGVPLSPFNRGVRQLGFTPTQPPCVEASTPEAGPALWHAAGLTAIETTVLRITVSFKDFDDFWQSNTLPVGPQAKFISELPEHTKAELRAMLKNSLPIAADGSISYQAVANAVKGVKPYSSPRSSERG